MSSLYQENNIVTDPLKIVIADDEQDVLKHFRESLESLGHEVVAAVANGTDLVERAHSLHPDLIITDIKMPDMDGIEAADRISLEAPPIPVILVSAYHDSQLIERALSDHVLAYLVKPVTQADFKPAIALAMRRFREFQTLRKEADDLRQALEDRKLVERAKAFLIKHAGLNEADAFRRIQKLSRDKNRRMADVARDILLAEEAFGT